jgi:Secretion system C-terminal sorting domain
MNHLRTNGLRVLCPIRIFDPSKNTLAMRSRLALLFLVLQTNTFLHAQRVVPFGLGVPGTGAFGVYALQVWQDKLVVGGRYNSLLGHAGSNIQAWDGTQFYPMTGAFEGLSTLRVYDLEVFNDDLVACGRDSAGYGGIARWDGTQWHSFDHGSPATVQTMTIFNSALVMGGADGTVCQWNGTAWDTLGTPFNATIFDLEVYNGDLYAGGSFTADVNGSTLKRLARWNGTAWQPVSTGVNGSVYALCPIDQGLAIGGNFSANGDSTQLLPSWTVYDGTAFSTETYDPAGAVRGIERLPSGDLLIGSLRSALLRGPEVHPLDEYNDLRTAAVFQGNILIGAETLGYYGLAEAIPNNLAQLLPYGDHQAPVDAGSMACATTPTPFLCQRWWTDRPGLEALKGDSTYPLYMTQPWMLAKQNGAWSSSAPGYPGSADSALWAGPTADVEDSAYHHRYHQVWKLEQWMIDQHAQNWNQGWYTMPNVIASWPGNGHTANGEPARLAPFQDMDGDGVYEPASGDYPLIRGDEASYWILHGREDANGLHPAMRFDMHVMQYAYGDPIDPDRYNSVLTNFRIINRSGTDYDSVRFGMYADWDIGGYRDDRLECDSTRNLFYAFNADSLDSDVPFSDTTPFANGYQENPPALGMKFLNQPMSAHRGGLGGDILSIEDGLNGTVNGEPFTQPGYSSHFQFPGGDQADTTNNYLDRQAVGSCGPFTWAANDTLCFDIALIFARTTTGDPYESVTLLKQRADAVQNWYDAQNISCSVIEDVVSVPEVAVPLLSVFPNPASGRVTLSGASPKTNSTVIVYDAMGTIVSRGAWQKGRNTTDLELGTLGNGVYVVELHTPAGRSSARVVLAR